MGHILIHLAAELALRCVGQVTSSETICRPKPIAHRKPGEDLYLERHIGSPDYVRAWREFSAEEESSVGGARRVPASHTEPPGESVRLSRERGPIQAFPKLEEFSDSWDRRRTTNVLHPFMASEGVRDAMRRAAGLTNSNRCGASIAGLHPSIQGSCQKLIALPSPSWHLRAARAKCSLIGKSESWSPAQGLSSTVFLNQRHLMRRAWLSNGRLRTPRPP